MSWLVASTRCEAGVSTILVWPWISSSSLPVLLCCPFWGCLFSHWAFCVLVLVFSGISVLTENICDYHYIMCWYWHTSMVIFTGKNKRVGKQLASQKILQLLHPHVKNWGSLLRMYGRENSKLVKQVSRLCLIITYTVTGVSLLDFSGFFKLSYNRTLRCLDVIDSNNCVHLLSPKSKLKNLFN